MNGRHQETPLVSFNVHLNVRRVNPAGWFSPICRLTAQLRKPLQALSGARLQHAVRSQESKGEGGKWGGVTEVCEALHARVMCLLRILKV